MKPRAICSSAIPRSLWDQKRISLPQKLTELYMRQRAIATKEVGTDRANRQIGGASREETLKHFRDLFENSAGRICAAFLDPESSFWPLSNYLPSLLSDGDVAVLDAPSGTGAAGLALVSILMQLREERVIPTLPITIRILAADVSDLSLEIYKTMALGLGQEALQHGIEVRFQSIRWNALDAVS